MSFSVIAGEKFKKQAKKLVRKYPSLKKELGTLAVSLSSNPEQGTSLGNNTFKIRLAVKSKHTGKSGGMRVITYLITKEKELYLLSIYDKSEIDTVDDFTLEKLITMVRKNLK